MQDSFVIPASLFTHPLAVADIVADLGLDTTTIVATILHDAVEDTQLTTEDIGRGVYARDQAIGRRRYQAL